MDNKLDINVTEKIVSDENILKTVEEAETGLFMIKARKYYRNSIKVDDITYSQMKAIFDILGIDTEEVLK